jgi:hypothetical protein
MKPIVNPTPPPIIAPILELVSSVGILNAEPYFTNRRYSDHNSNELDDTHVSAIQRVLEVGGPFQTLALRNHAPNVFVPVSSSEPASDS